MTLEAPVSKETAELCHKCKKEKINLHKNYRSKSRSVLWAYFKNTGI